MKELAFSEMFYTLIDDFIGFSEIFFIDDKSYLCPCRNDVEDVKPIL